ncbi:hypothetical protein SynBIOSE41_00740 [Synechococcus sp. BIOS-E4-1]|nr:hypothetical protein SynBIOSE41_00740 [Synechococcus sp. BIOS-E4-1]
MTWFLSGRKFLRHSIGRSSGLNQSSMNDWLNVLRNATL